MSIISEVTMIITTSRQYYVSFSLLININININIKIIHNILILYTTDINEVRANTCRKH